MPTACSLQRRELRSDPGYGAVDDGPPEHAGPVEIHVTLWIRQDLEDGGRRRFDPA